MSFIITELPLYKEANYRYTISLEGRQRTVAYYWNEREGAWHFDLKNIDGTKILMGQKIVPRYPIATDYRLDAYNLTGYFILMPNNPDTQVDPTDSDFVPQFYKFFYVYSPLEA